jgi:predicted ATP-grasp superfamily ATP-dependent carboligase
LELTHSLFKQYKRLVIKKSELAGGYKMKTVSSIGDVQEYCRVQDKDFLNGEFLVSEYIPHEQSFSGMGIIGRDGTINWCGATEQVLYNDFAYEGLISPPYVDDKGLRDIKEITLEVGKNLAEYGYFGYFNVDFIKGTDEMYAVEINARFCFSTIFYACCCGERFWRAMQGEKVIECNDDRRLILGKIKAKEGKSYSGLVDKSDILKWFNSGIGGFKTCYVGTDDLECYDYGSFIGLFGEFLPYETNRDDTLKLFWDRCLQQYR